MVDALKNFAYSTVFLAPSPATSGPTLTVQPGDGAKFPTAPFDITLYAVGTQPLSNNAEIARCTAVGNATLSAALTSGTAYTSLTVTALLGAIAIGDPVYLVSGSNTQQFTASAAAAIGATTISVQSQAANFSYPIGTFVDPDMLIMNRAQYGTIAQLVAITWAVDNAVTANLLTQISAGGVAPATTVTGPDAFGAAAVIGVGTTYARADHDHGLPAAPADIPLATVTTAGDLIVGTGAGAVTRLGVGTSSQVLFGGTTPTWGAAPAGALSNASGEFAATSLPVNTVTNFGYTASLGIGTWLVIVMAGFDVPSGSLASSVTLEFTLSGGTATYSTSLAGYAEDSFPSGTGTGVPRQLTVAQILTVTAAGTVGASAVWNTSGTVAGRVGYYGITGYTAIKIA